MVPYSTYFAFELTPYHSRYALITTSLEQAPWVHWNNVELQRRTTWKMLLPAWALRFLPYDLLYVVCIRSTKKLGEEINPVHGDATCSLSFSLARHDSLIGPTNYKSAYEYRYYYYYT
jgi:hypothetical protein